MNGLWNQTGGSHFQLVHLAALHNPGDLQKLSEAVMCQMSSVAMLCLATWVALRI